MMWVAVNPLENHNVWFIYMCTCHSCTCRQNERWEKQVWTSIPTGQAAETAKRDLSPGKHGPLQDQNWGTASIGTCCVSWFSCPQPTTCFSRLWSLPPNSALSSQYEPIRVSHAVGLHRAQRPDSVWSILTFSHTLLSKLPHIPSREKRGPVQLQSCFCDSPRSTLSNCSLHTCTYTHCDTHTNLNSKFDPNSSTELDSHLNPNP